MSRFDLFFVVLDECDETADFNIAQHIIRVHQNRAEVKASFVSFPRFPIPFSLFSFPAPPPLCSCLSVLRLFLPSLLRSIFISAVVYRNFYWLPIPSIAVIDGRCLEQFPASLYSSIFDFFFFCAVFCAYTNQKLCGCNMTHCVLEIGFHNRFGVVRYN